MTAKPAQNWTLLLNGGGVRSLIAAATLADRPNVAALYIHDGRPSDPHRHTAFLQQSEHFHIVRRLELRVPHLAAAGDAAQRRSATAPLAPLADAQILLAGISLAIQLDAERMVWPVQVGADFEAASRVIETIVLAQHIAQIDQGRSIPIDTPLLEMTGKHLLELGITMQVPFALARSCTADTAIPCGTCAGCIRRRDYFEQAGVDDPLLSLDAQR